MKRSPLFIIAAAITLLLIPPFATDLFAALSPNQVSGAQFKKSEYPIGQKCIITVDALDGTSPVFAGSANIITGFDAPNTVRGTLTEEKEHWLILQHGKSQRWIPKSKILLINFSS